MRACKFLSIMLCAALVSCGGTAPSTHSGSELPTRAEALPKLIAHRGGTADYPENSLLAIEQSLRNGADAIWLTVQLSQDGIPMLYRPADLSALTNLSGRVADRGAQELEQANAGWQFGMKAADGTISYPYRTARVGIPTLRAALRAIPANVPITLDMKALPAEPQTQAVVQVLEEEGATQRVTLYSTDQSYQSALARYPQVRTFEARDVTRQRLLTMALRQSCDTPPASGTWTGFEFDRQTEVTERFTLGEGRSNVLARLWTTPSARCFKTHPKVTIVAFAVNDADTYRAAACVGVDEVLVDSPRAMATMRRALTLPLACP
jgi:glycerophosphoryl diester phosphodiesterase